ncbi:MAG: DUF2258 domain-containing protein [Thaumarchaeota archaeon]|nr:MAG: DUF2258 domain-containing protein [Nitrososphaerota archaeon]RLG04303.1 MAG: DUF2258 domain-containing protein [Nitrososphaerota archaeon]
MNKGAEKLGEKQILRTGIVIAGAYADRVRRVLYAQLSGMIKEKRIDSKEVARAAGELNQILYDAFVRNLALSKGDLVRIEIPYTVSGGRISWDYSSLKVRAFREIGEEVVEKAVEEALKGRQAQEAVSR